LDPRYAGATYYLDAMFFLVVTMGFLSVGLVALLWPRRIQTTALRFYEVHPWHAKFNPFLDWIRTDYYVHSLRVIGIASTTIGLYLLWIFTKKILE
jgi:hypothetical protein